MLLIRPHPAGQAGLKAVSHHQTLHRLPAGARQRHRRSLVSADPSTSERVSSAEDAGLVDGPQPGSVGLAAGYLGCGAGGNAC